MIRRSLIVVHRWLGVGLCLLFLIWFPSGIVLMYWTYPTVTASHRLARSPVLDLARVTVTPSDVAERHRIVLEPERTRLVSFDGRPAYRTSSARGPARLVYADTGEEQGPADRAQRDHLAAAWTGRSAKEARVELVTEPDQWTLPGAVRALLPLHRYTWPDGEQVYVAGRTGEVVQHTTRATRLGAYLGAIPHWLYFTPLRTNQPLWLQVTIWTAFLGTVSALVGVVIGAWWYSPSKRYRIDGQARRIPYRGQKRWHTILGLVFGAATVTWAFSGMLSLDPFPSVLERLQPAGPPTGPDASAVAAALRGEVAPEAWQGFRPGEIAARQTEGDIREISFTSFAGEPLLALHFADGRSRLATLDGAPLHALPLDRIATTLRSIAPDPERLEVSLLERYDRYYLDRTGTLPLPVAVARFNDPDATRYYIDPATGRVVGRYSARQRIGRWLYRGLHSLDFPWLYAHRPLWDVVVITFMVGGTALAGTGVVLAWRVVGRRLGFRDQRSVKDEA